MEYRISPHRISYANFIPDDVRVARDSFVRKFMPLPPFEEAQRIEWLVSPRVVGVGVGFLPQSSKRPNWSGHVEPEEYFLRAYLASELPAPLPSESRGYKIVPEILGVAVASQTVPSVSPKQNRIKRLNPPRPAVGGASIGHCLGGAGTLSCLVRDGISSSLFVLSNNHVIAQCNGAKPGETIVQPAVPDGGSNPSDVLARLYKHVPLHFGGFQVNNVDAAIAEIDNANAMKVAPFILQIGEIQDVLDTALLPRGGIGLSVKKMGCASELTKGSIYDPSALIDVWYPDVRNFARFDNQLVVSPIAGTTSFAEKGDSGALVLDDSNRAVGLLFAVTDSGRAFVNPIQAVVDELGVEPFTIRW